MHIEGYSGRITSKPWNSSFMDRKPLSTKPDSLKIDNLDRM
jgi:hypothetical protein